VFGVCNRSYVFGELLFESNEKKFGSEELRVKDWPERNMLSILYNSRVMLESIFVNL